MYELRKKVSDKRFDLVEAQRELDRMTRTVSAMEADHTEATFWLEEMRIDHPHTSIRRSSERVSDSAGGN